VSHLLSDFFPCKLPLRAQKIRGVFDYEHRSRLPVTEV
jgi:hypothetical protein